MQQYFEPCEINEVNNNHLSGLRAGSRIASLTNCIDSFDLTVKNSLIVFLAIIYDQAWLLRETNFFSTVPINCLVLLV